MSGNIVRTSKQITELIKINETIAASGTFETGSISLDSEVATNGEYSIQVTATGSGTAKIEFKLSNDGTTFVTPSSASEIVTGLTAGSDMIAFSPMVAKFMKLLITETGTTNSIDIIATVVTQ